MSEGQTVEERAKAMGWSPKEEFRGDVEKWIDAETFVKRGEEILPIVNANNKRLTADLDRTNRELAKTQELLKNATEAIEALKEVQTSATIKDVKAERARLVTAVADARKEGDVEKEMELTDKLAETREAIKEAEETPSKKKDEEGTRRAAPNDPAFTAWKEANTWFGTDKRKSNIAMAIAAEVKADNPSLTGQRFFDKVDEELDKTFGSNQRRPGSTKVEESRGSGGGGGGSGGGKSYADLPPDVKATCDRQAARVVGEGRAFKDQAAWRAHYAKMYFEA